MSHVGAALPNRRARPDEPANGKHKKEWNMAKGQKRSNKEARKPRAEKPAKIHGASAMQSAVNLKEPR